jgi:hypothetical protein
MLIPMAAVTIPTIPKNRRQMNKSSVRMLIVNGFSVY